MLNRLYLLFILLLCTGLYNKHRAQLNLTYEVITVPERCEKGEATLNMSGQLNSDSIVINWSTGEKNVASVKNQDVGQHNVRIYLKRTLDKKFLLKDTLISFVVDKQNCEVNVSPFFSPNGDGYNDVLQISNLQYYPNFELEVYNKWGQRVHHQKKEYTPWDGKWLEADLPDGTYYYVLFLNPSNKNRHLKGTINILR